MTGLWRGWVPIAELTLDGPNLGRPAVPTTIAVLWYTLHGHAQADFIERRLRQP